MPEPPVLCSLCGAEIQGKPVFILDSGPICDECDAKATRRLLAALKSKKDKENANKQPHR